MIGDGQALAAVAIGKNCDVIGRQLRRGRRREQGQEKEGKRADRTIEGTGMGHVPNYTMFLHRKGIETCCSS